MKTVFNTRACSLYSRFVFNSMRLFSSFQKTREESQRTHGGEEISELTQAIAEIDASVAEATLTRQEEKANNKETVEDAKEAQTAVSQATAVLKEFYRKAATATALVPAFWQIAESGRRQAGRSC